jgi:hypothetical protein
LINVLGVSATGAVFLAAHDSSSIIASCQNILDLLFKTINDVGPSNVIQVITDNATNCMGVSKIIEGVHPHIFWSACLVHTLNRLCMILSSIENVDGLISCTREGSNSSNLSPGIQGSITSTTLTLGCIYLRLQTLDLLAITPPLGAY